MRLDAEIGIVGAGPAGARAAELLAEAGADVVLWDPRAPWEKPCGGGLTAAALAGVPELAAILPEARAIASMRLETVEGGAIEFPLDAPLHVIARTRLGLWQLDRARRAGARLDPDVVAKVERVPGGAWRVLLGSGRTRTVRLLVGADGAASMVRRAASPGFRIGLDPTRVLLACGPGPTPAAIVTRFFGHAGGYLWDFPRPDHRSVGVSAVPRTWTRGRFDAEIDRYRVGRPTRCGENGAARGAVIGTASLPRSASYAEVGGADFALLGDAAGFADPATGEGIFTALRSAGLLAEAYRRTRGFADYPRLAAQCFEREFRLSRRVRRLLDRPGPAARIVERATRRAAVASLLAAAANAYNEHDPRLLHLCGRAWRLARARRPPEQRGAAGAAPFHAPLAHGTVSLWRPRMAGTEPGSEP